MPPNANFTGLRHRTGSLESENGNETNADDSTIRCIQTIKELKGNEVAIGGIVYDLTDFKHPGGNSIRIFGGNDVTVQYNMIHPYHTNKHLEKMKKVGSVAKYRNE